MTGLRRRLPSTGALFVFEAAARHENFTRAAQELNVTQPAVSRTLSGLESFLGTQLFVRERPGARLTEDGRILLAAVSDAFSGVEKALSRIEERRTGKSTVTLSVSTAFTTHWLMPRISRVQAAFPDVDLRFQLISGPVGGPVGDVDLAMRFFAPGTSDGRFIMHEAYVPVCAPGYRDMHGAEGAALIGLEDGDIARLARYVTGAGPERLVFSDYAVVLHAALAGQGVAAGWLNVVPHWIAEARLVPAAGSLCRPGRECRLLGGAAGAPARVAEWIVAELRRDLLLVSDRHPALGIGAILEEEAGR